MTSEALLLVLFYVLVAVGIGAGILLAPTFLGPRLARRGKLEPYECGVPLLGSARVRLNAKFYLYALLFVLFDVETALLVLWALVYRELAAQGTLWKLGLLLEGGLFLTILAFGLWYLWRRGALAWEEGAAALPPQSW
jgi:NADH-quinone oxidoreductase subunit A